MANGNRIVMNQIMQRMDVLLLQNLLRSRRRLPFGYTSHNATASRSDVMASRVGVNSCAR